jgi:hypothetical protein
MKKFKVVLLITGILLWFGTGGVEAASNQGVIELLKEKGVITKEEAASLKKEGEAVLSLRDGKVRLGGELELEFVKSDQNDDPDNNPHSRFAIDKVVLSPQVKFSDRITFQSDIEAEGAGKIKVDEAWVNFDELPRKSWVKIGLEDIFMKPHRKTEAYPILGHAFWQDEDLGIYLGGEEERFYWRFSVTNGRHLKDRRISEDDVFPITTDDDDNIETNGNKQVGVGLGMDHSFKEEHHIDILPFYYISRLSDEDVAYLKGISTYGTSDADDQHRYGLNLEYLLRGFTFFGQYMRATDGKMDRDGWYVQESYKLKFKERKIFTAVEFLFRHENYNVDLSHDPSDSRTWDRRATTLAVITDIVKNLKVKTEYYFHDEDTGGDDVDNNELLVQLEAKF